MHCFVCKDTVKFLIDEIYSFKNTQHEHVMYVYLLCVTNILQLFMVHYNIIQSQASRHSTTTTTSTASSLVVSYRASDDPTKKANHVRTGWLLTVHTDTTHRYWLFYYRQQLTTAHTNMHHQQKHNYNKTHNYTRCVEEFNFHLVVSDNSMCIIIDTCMIHDWIEVLMNFMH